MLITVPQLKGLHEQLVLVRLDSVERLVADAQFVTGIEVVIVVQQHLDHVGVGVLAGDEAIIEVAKGAPWACWFLGARPWVPVLITDVDGLLCVTFARAVEKPADYLPPVGDRRGDLR